MASSVLLVLAEDIHAVLPLPAPTVASHVVASPESSEHGVAKVRVELAVSSSETDFDRQEVRDFWQTSAGDVSMNDECEVDIRFAVVLEKNTNRVALGELLAVGGKTTELTYVNPTIPKE